jgi:hypothetical protein
MDITKSISSSDILFSILAEAGNPAPKECVPLNDKSTLFISIFLCVGLVISYLPQVSWFLGLCITFTQLHYNVSITESL